MSDVVKLAKLACQETAKALVTSTDPAATMAAGKVALYEVVQEYVAEHHGMTLDHDETVLLVKCAVAELN